ncbi:uncharacterized protein LOC129594554 [Paramacrobiotus metropolitanus]|uniref:uncharacterized protein LOC129594554 n=1 Tax=Paramacrobiotus metropolitanus TaxID=2943436 RepID=UPI002446552E|nr:uncharacterized protein LOC129594554 [Paramacrobiotus metropolitanus]
MNVFVLLLLVAALLAFSGAMLVEKGSSSILMEENVKTPPETDPAQPRKKRNMSAQILIPDITDKKPFRLHPSSGAQNFKGKATFYTPAMGACGKVNTESEMVVAVSKVQYG